ncbi:TetR/AcrR family transcriptional regulator [Micromonospora sp. NPDC094482]|uniref:TetR/AcrR family transcriptional regulator n=1 Tax=unclassified Micromonospora TaxID=2617518 RepID=UPI003332056A
MLKTREADDASTGSVLPKRVPSPKNARAAAAAQTRERLIETGLRLAERTGLAGLSINLLVDEAGVSKGSFFHHFKDRASYLLALHSNFHERLRDEIQRAIDQMPPGVDRLLVASKTYLDACLRDRGVRALLLEARAEAPIADAVRLRNAQMAELCAADFRAMGWPHPLDAARLWVGLVAEGALIELDAGRLHRNTRTTLRWFLQRP